jgi:hypothetical protein
MHGETLTFERDQTSPRFVQGLADDTKSRIARLLAVRRHWIPAAKWKQSARISVSHRIALSKSGSRKTVMDTLERDQAIVLGAPASSDAVHRIDIASVRVTGSHTLN